MPPAAARTPAWASTGTAAYATTGRAWAVELLDAPLASGAWAWTLRVDAATRGAFFVGLAAGAVSPSRFLGDQRAGYAYGDAGVAMHGAAVSMSRPTFAAADTLRLELDVDARALRVRVNDGDPFEPFPALDTRPLPGAGPVLFTPAVCFGAPCAVTLLSFESLSPEPRPELPTDDSPLV